MGGAGWRGWRGLGLVANVDDSSSGSLLCEVAFDCELVTCSCYLLLLSGLPRTPPPPQKGKGWMGGGEPIIGQAALIVWLNSWLTEWEMGGVVVWVVCVDMREREMVKKCKALAICHPCGHLSSPHSLSLMSSMHLFSRIMHFLYRGSDKGMQLITASTPSCCCKYSRIDGEPSEMFIDRVKAANLLQFALEKDVHLLLPTTEACKRLHAKHNYAKLV